MGKRGKGRPEEDWAKKLCDQAVDLINHGKGDTLVAESRDGKEKLTAWEWLKICGGTIEMHLPDGESIALPSEVIEKLVRLGFKINEPIDFQEILKHVPEEHRKDFLKGATDPTYHPSKEEIERALGLDRYKKEMN